MLHVSGLDDRTINTQNRPLNGGGRPPAWKRAAIGSLLLGSLLLTTACGGSSSADAEASGSKPAASTSATSASSKAIAPAEKSTKEAKKAPVAKPLSAELKKDHIQLSGKVLKNKNGSYQQLEVAPDSPLLRFDKSQHNATHADRINGDLPTGWTAKDAKRAQKFAATFYLQGVIDIPLNGDYTREKFETWSKKWVKKMDPEYAPDILQSAGEKDESFLPLNNYGDDNAEYNAIGYHHVQKKNAPRVTDFNIKTLSTSTLEDHYFSIFFGGDYSMAGVDKTDKTYVEKTNVKRGEVIVKKSGKSFLISGVHTDTQTDVLDGK